MKENKILQYTDLLFDISTKKYDLHILYKCYLNKENYAFIFRGDFGYMLIDLNIIKLSELIRLRVSDLFWICITLLNNPKVDFDKFSLTVFNKCDNTSELIKLAKTMITAAEELIDSCENPNPTYEWSEKIDQIVLDLIVINNADSNNIAKVDSSKMIILNKVCTYKYYVNIAAVYQPLVYVDRKTDLYNKIYNKIDKNYLNKIKTQLALAKICN